MISRTVRYFICPECGQAAEAYDDTDYVVVCIDPSHEDPVQMIRVLGEEYASLEGLDHVYGDCD